MKVTVLQENLARGLGIVSRAVSPRSTLPVLANVMIATDEAVYGSRLPTWKWGSRAGSRLASKRRALQLCHRAPLRTWSTHCPASR